MDYKNTLNMPKTDFEMRANLTNKEPVFRDKWIQDKIYQLVLEKNKNNDKFILHDGPPYANGDLHVGHALNKILKDIIVRYKSLRGFYSPFVPGWDTHGLPIEHRMLQEANQNKNQLEPSELRKKAREYALKQIVNQKEQFKTLQMFSDFEKIYVTLDTNYVAKQLEVFKKMVLDGLVYKGLKPVFWSPTSQSALAEAEVEYEDVKSPSIYVSLPIVKSDLDKLPVGTNLVIWTTTPWTLLANAGVAVGESLLYLVVKHNDNHYVISEDLIDTINDKFGWNNEYQIINKFKGSEVIDKNIIYHTPILKHEAPLIIGHHVTSESGTGLVHIAPLFGEDDFKIGQSHKLEFIMHISDTGHVENTNTQFDGMFYMDANKEISAFLGDKLLKFEWFKHSYPHDWRTHQPIIFRGTPQWFVSIDKIRKQIVNQIQDNVKTYPDWAKNRLIQMIEGRHDWTISRQRTWGVPIIIFYNKDKEIVANSETFDYVIDLVKKHSIEIWWEWETDQLLPEKYRNQGFTREMDIMDVWFDSGVSSIAVDIDKGIESPYDLYLEGVDQYRGWFNSSIINSVAYKGVAPYQNLISHGFVLDGKGQKMSKSKGNIISPQEVVSQRGAEILRLWVANSEYSNDINISNEILDQNTEIYRKFRNTIKYLLGNLGDYTYRNVERTGIHLYIQENLKNIKQIVLEAYDEFKFINVIKHLNNYIVDLSAFYLSIIKDIIYIRRVNDSERQMVLANLYEITEFLLLAIAPFLPTTAEEAYKYLNKQNKVASIMLEDFSAISTNEINYKLLDQYKEFFALRNKVNILIEAEIKNGNVKRSNELELTLENPSEFIRSLDLKTLLMVGKVTYGSTTSVMRFESLKCQRCWNHYEANQMINDLCCECSLIIKELQN
ncbi:isoleucine--tRNA ligase [Mycoplasma corogypsi]|uniref:isoleucine--tRNA ligase n=1 Tax=Mycoplasma corogypsi TaxID=2106 RepID=UPI003873C717